MAGRLRASLALALLLGTPGALLAQEPPTIEGRLGDGDAREQREGERHVDTQVFRLEAGRRYRIHVGSSFFYPVIALRRAGSVDSLIEPDNYRDPGDLGPRVIYTPAESGDYELSIRADDSTTEGEGSYGMSIEELPPLPPPRPAQGGERAQGGWSIYEGELASEDPDRDGYVDYAVEMRAGETRLFLAESAAFGPEMWIVPAASRDGNPLSAGGNEGSPLALQVYTAAEDGAVIVRITTDASGGTGRYRLRISDPLSPAAVGVSGAE